MPFKIGRVEIIFQDFEFFSTHPADKTRQENLENKIENAIKIR